MKSLPPALKFRLDALLDPRIALFLQEHLSDMHKVSPAESVHALDLVALRHPSIHFWSAWSEDGTTLAATGALKQLSQSHGEIKSMRTAAALRGRGVASKMLEHLIAQAQGMGWQRLSLETGSQEYFRPARALYVKHGFGYCPPFEGYSEDPNSCYMSLIL